jgi:anaerobic dimethyl sulfoxide reductase subunit A
MTIGLLLSGFGGCTPFWGDASAEGAIFAARTIYGTLTNGNTRDDLVNSRLILLWGVNPATSIFSTNTRYYLFKAKEAGAGIVVIDPRYTDTAATFADQWIPIKPGTDTAVMASMAYVIITEGLQDQAFLDKYTLGFDKFREYVMGQEDGTAKTPEWASKITGVPAATIERLAKWYASTKPACLMDCQGPGRAAEGEQYNRCASTLTAMTGNIGKHGGSAAGGLMGIPYGHMFRAAGIPGIRNPVESGGPSVRGSIDLKERLVRRIHVNKIWDGFLKGKAGGYPADIKMAWFPGSNPLNQRGNANKGVQALRSLEFCVVQDFFITPTARYADIVLPVASFAEKNDLTRPWPSGPYLTVMNQAIERVGECKSDWEIGCLLAQKLGFKDFDNYTEDQWLRQFAKENPEYKQYITDYDKFKEDGIYRIKLEEPYVAFQKQIEDPEHNKFATPSGKIEIFSQRVADLNDSLCPPVPKYVPTWENRDDPLVKKYPLQLLSPHPRVRVHSTLQKVDWLEEVEPHVMWINPVDAEPRGVRNGDTCLVFNDRGKLAIKAWVTKRIVPGVVAIYEGAWFQPDGEGVDRGGCVNTLTNDAYSPGGAAALKTALVDVAVEVK